MGHRLLRGSLPSRYVLLSTEFIALHIIPPCLFFQGKGFYVAAGGGSAYQSFTHIKTAIEDGRFNAKLLNLSDKICLLSVQGPKRYVGIT